MLNQTYCLTSILYKEYAAKNPDGPCCDATGYHQRCLCKKQNVQFCKDLCDSDDFCKGYVKHGADCQIATTKTDCNTDCQGPENVGNQGALVDTGHCGIGESKYHKFKGCFIKIKSK